MHCIEECSVNKLKIKGMERSDFCDKSKPKF